MGTYFFFKSFESPQRTVVGLRPRPPVPSEPRLEDMNVPQLVAHAHEDAVRRTVQRVAPKRTPLPHEPDRHVEGVVVGAPARAAHPHDARQVQVPSRQVHQHVPRKIPQHSFKKTWHKKFTDSVCVCLGLPLLPLSVNHRLHARSPSEGLMFEDAVRRGLAVDGDVARIPRAHTHRTTEPVTQESSAPNRKVAEAYPKGFA